MSEKLRSLLCVFWPQEGRPSSTPTHIQRQTIQHNSPCFNPRFINKVQQSEFHLSLLELRYSAMCYRYLHCGILTASLTPPVALPHQSPSCPLNGKLHGPPRDEMDTSEKAKCDSVPGIEERSLDCPACTTVTTLTEL
jgi:hypothetical protein